MPKSKLKKLKGGSLKCPTCGTKFIKDFIKDLEKDLDPRALALLKSKRKKNK